MGDCWAPGGPQSRCQGKQMSLQHWQPSAPSLPRSPEWQSSQTPANLGLQPSIACSNWHFPGSLPSSTDNIFLSHQIIRLPPRTTPLRPEDDKNCSTLVKRVRLFSARRSAWEQTVQLPDPVHSVGVSSVQFRQLTLHCSKKSLCSL
jgi:hypothetical protein